MSNYEMKGGLAFPIPKPPTLHPPPEPIVIVDKPKKRKNLSISQNIFKKLETIKGERSWNAFMMEVIRERDIFTRMEELLQQYKGATEAYSEVVGIKHKPPKRMSDLDFKRPSKEEKLPISNVQYDGRIELIKELKTIIKSSDNIRNILKPLSEEELKVIQLSDEEINKRLSPKNGVNE